MVDSLTKANKKRVSLQAFISINVFIKQGVTMSKSWKCPKCDCTDYDTDTIATTGSGWSKVFDMQNRKFTAVICSNCTYTEFYRGKASTLGNVFDLFTN